MSTPTTASKPTADSRIQHSGNQHSGIDNSGTNPGTTAKSALIIGLGNLLLSDEGVGIHVLRRLEQGFDFNPSVALVDGGTSGLDLLSLFSEHQQVLLIDALFAPNSPHGAIEVLRNDAILAALSKKMSMHHLGISDVLALSQLLGYRPREIVLLGVVAGDLELGTKLSPSVKQQLPGILACTQEILGGWKIEMRARQPQASLADPTDAELFQSFRARSD